MSISHNKAAVIAESKRFEFFILVFTGNSCSQIYLPESVNTPLQRQTINLSHETEENVTAACLLKPTVTIFFSPIYLSNSGNMSVFTITNGHIR